MQYPLPFSTCVCVCVQHVSFLYARHISYHFTYNVILIRVSKESQRIYALHMHRQTHIAM